MWFQSSNKRRWRLVSIYIWLRREKDFSYSSAKNSCRTNKISGGLSPHKKECGGIAADSVLFLDKKRLQNVPIRHNRT